MTKQAEKKTNAMRELERAGQSYEAHSFECPEAISGVEVARVLNEDPDCVFKSSRDCRQERGSLCVHDSCCYGA